ncbi:unnamed protein product [Kuraishia capsulata CBS 1993]|uniref:Ankyrin repeat-containing protein YAR1 n=1 Tax=Kuraishia capsulata CBS 1993 TaxID=1382522 RepID=W6MR33_9ASCO|nr:uncharacterized protein KUCA_T00000285001 [Kuraishia capsulata CBS 1993]CDK24325.1 unnamed protein product [Kuraishia capsulata CBS 1993]
MADTEISQEDMGHIIFDARIGDLEILEEIFAEVDPKLLLKIEEETTKVTPIHMAAANGHSEVIKYLLSLLSEEDSKFLVNKRNEHGNTALHWAALNGHLDAVKVLCEYGADAFIQNNIGRDAIYEAENNDKGDVGNFLLQHFSVEPEEDEEEEEGKETTAKDVQIQPGTEIQNATEESKAALEDLTQETENLNVE